MNTIRAAILVALAVGGSCNDLQFGSSNGRIVFNETIQASPAIWRQSQQITINVTDQEVISCVVVTDQRPEKDGDAKIVEGGEGQQNVTIELKSPTVFRGFDFHVVVYAAQGSVQHPLTQPAVMTKDVDLTNANVDTVTHKVTEKQGNDGPIPPTLVGDTDVPRKSRNTEQPDSIVKFITEKTVPEVDQSTTEVTKEIATEVTTESDLKLNGPTTPITFPKEFTTEHNKAQTKEQAFPTITLKDIGIKTPSNVFPSEQSSSTTVPLKDFDVNITTGLPEVATSTTEKTHEKMVQQNLDSISKELGQKVVFGIRNH